MIRRGEPKADDGIGYPDRRTCHNPDCDRTFTPAAPMSGESTEYHCSPECAAACLRRRREPAAVETD